MPHIKVPRGPRVEAPDSCPTLWSRKSGHTRIWSLKFRHKFARTFGKCLSRLLRPNFGKTRLSWPGFGESRRLRLGLENRTVSTLVGKVSQSSSRSRKSGRLHFDWESLEMTKIGRAVSWDTLVEPSPPWSRKSSWVFRSPKSGNGKTCSQKSKVKNTKYRSQYFWAPPFRPWKLRRIIVIAKVWNCGVSVAKVTCQNIVTKVCPLWQKWFPVDLTWF